MTSGFASAMTSPVSPGETVQQPGVVLGGDERWLLGRTKDKHPAWHTHVPSMALGHLCGSKNDKEP